VFDYIEMLYNLKRKHVRNAMLRPSRLKTAQSITCGCLRNSALFTSDLIHKALVLRKIDIFAENDRAIPQLVYQ
jgi:hypothetical protein